MIFKKMVLGIFNESFNNFLKVLPPVLTENIEWIITILKTLGIIAIIYLIYLVIMISLGIRKLRELRKIRKKVKDMDSKIDLLIKKSGIKVPRGLGVEEVRISIWDRIMARFSR